MLVQEIGPEELHAMEFDFKVIAGFLNVDEFRVGDAQLEGLLRCAWHTWSADFILGLAAMLEECEER